MKEFSIEIALIIIYTNNLQLDAYVMCVST